MIFLIFLLKTRSGQKCTLSLQYHVENCPDRVIVDKFRNPIVDSLDALQRKEVKMIMQDDTDDWDREPPVPAYDPQKYCESSNVIRHCHGMQPHERRAFRQQELVRLRGAKSLDLDNK